jgi:hypothetical protein
MELATAEVALTAGDHVLAKQSAQYTLDYYRGVGARASMLRAAALIKQSCARPNDQDFAQIIAFGLDTLHQLQQSWSPADYASFTARPDVRQEIQTLTQK